AHCTAGRAGQGCARRRLVEGRKGIRKSRHRAPDTNAARIHAAAGMAKRAAGDDVALDDRAPATELDHAFLVPIFLRESTLLLRAGTHAAAIDRIPEHPSRAAELVEFWQRADPGKEH